jgi:hypothetical protein
VGYLNAAFGVGALAGGLVAVGRSSLGRTARDFGVGVILWALPLAVIVAFPFTVPTLLALAATGAGNPIVDVNASTILQRLTPPAVMGRVFGALETGLMGSLALGAAVMPVLDRWVGVRGALLVLAGGITLLVLPSFAALSRLDRSLTPPPALDRLRGVHLFAPLPLPVLESLARQSTRLEVPAGTTVITEGAPGDLFYVIDSGEVAASAGQRLLRTEGPGEFFGEIALLRNVPRTATVVTTAPTVLFALEREPFLEAVTGNGESAGAAEEIVTHRLMA